VKKSNFLIFFLHISMYVKSLADYVVQIFALNFEK